MRYRAIVLDGRCPRWRCPCRSPLAEGYNRLIASTAAAHFGEDIPPAAILLTHAHFDHAGSLPALVKRWHTHPPIYAHELELPYLAHWVRYPPNDPTVGGFMALNSRFMDTSRFTKVRSGVHALPGDGGVPGLLGWRWLPTPGHTPGHVSFFHDGTNLLVSGDAVITLNTDSAIDSLTKRRVLSRPPAYATYDWPEARMSAHRLAELKPETLYPGHGMPMGGPKLAEKLKRFAAGFQTPRHGRYAQTPARFNETGPISVPPESRDWPLLKAVVCGAVIGAALVTIKIVAGTGKR